MGQCIIKFKAKRLGDGKWVEGYYVKKVAHNVVSKYDVVEDGEEHFIFGMAKDDVQPYWYEVDHTTVCQFTGLKDCDGTSIFEHDLLRSEKPDSTYEVVWNQGNSSFSLINTEVPVLYPTNTMGRMLHRRLKVIGNIFDKDK